MKEVLFSQQSLEDVQEIEKYFKQSNFATAKTFEKYQQNLKEVVCLLREFPAIGSEYDVTEAFITPKLVSKGYVFLYIEFPKSVRVIQIANEKTN